MFRESRKMALVMAAVMLFTTFATCMASTAEEPTNLYVNGSFETAGEEWRLTQAEKAVDGAQDGSYYMTVNPGGSVKQTISGIKPFTSYTLSYWVKTSTTADVKIGPSIDFYGKVDGVEKNLGAFGWPCTFAQAETAEWQKFEIQFTSPSNAAVASLAPYIANSGTETIYLDNFSLVEDGGEPNLFLNGNLEVYNPNGTPWKWYAEDGKTNETYDSANNTRYWKPEKQGHELGSNVVYMDHDPVEGSRFKFVNTTGNGQYLYMRQDVSLAAGSYKLSFRFKSNDAEKAPCLRMLSAPGNPIVSNFQVAGVADQWMKYEYYFTLDAAAASVQFRMMNFCEAGTYYVDDIVLTPDTATVTAHGANMVTTNETKVGDRFIPAATISAVAPEEDGTRLVGVKTHYVPKTASESFTVINSVYKTENGVKTLVSVSVKDYAGIAAPTTVSDTVSVPAVEGEETCTVETFIWQSAGGLKPVLTPVVFA